MNEIPILINRKNSKNNELAFQIFPLEKKIKVTHRRQNTHDNIEKPHF
jgi:hypothetical protein